MGKHEITTMFCDGCGNDDYTDTNPFVQFRSVRPSDRTDMCCTLAGHLACFSPMPATSLPSIADAAGGGMATPEQWEEWIEGPGARSGFQWLT